MYGDIFREGRAPTVVTYQNVNKRCGDNVQTAVMVPPTVMRLTRRNPLRLEYDVHHLMDFTRATAMLDVVVACCIPLTSERQCDYTY